ncbi:hypothetical protein MSHI_36280 [Mycobacterium shinjukuense]|uniref:Transposase IS204/IS1001/IS1096/IS1165 DDE domain-containing protein n=1 Tax=Mycobacterium shinjukuense TaxID=398694 RepID=A0A7I7MV17_9MYCO|nr:transposase [Mycobacterium shinjukuense]BBX75722.1 hypothetical protein MSHI_36280 [Mycobacterium shinjukuense]
MLSPPAPLSDRTIIGDHDTGTVIDIQPGRSEESLANFYQSQPDSITSGIEVVSMDVSKAYTGATRTPSAASPANATLTGVDTLRLRYPNGESVNSEALVVDRRTGDLLVFEKTSSGDPRVCWAPGGLQNGSVTILQHVATVDLPGANSNLTTGADLSADGLHLAIRTYDDV